MSEIKLGKYRHFKAKEKVYEVLGISKHTETEEELVIYKALYQSKDYPYGQIWARPKDSFFAKVPEGKENPTGQEYRFEYIGDICEEE